MRTSRGTTTLLALEDAAPEVLFRTAPGTDEPIWPHVRFLLASAMAKVELGTEAVSSATGGSSWREFSRYAHAFIPGRIGPRRVRETGLIFFVGGTTVRTTGPTIENWLVDGFARAVANSTVFQGRPLRGRPAFASTYSLDAAFARLDVFNRLRPTTEPPIHAVRSVLTEVAAELDVPVSVPALDAIAQQVSYSLSRVDRMNQVFARALDRVHPDIVIMEDASYGGYAHVIRMMKGRGIHVVEPQHGWIGPSHAAYNFGRAMRAPELLVTLPDTLLTFGDFWSATIRHPGRVVAVGKPHMNAMADALPPFGERPRTVLIASSVSEPEKMSEFVLQVRNALPVSWRVIFRPHPSERSTQASRYPRLASATGVEFDSNTDVYESMRSTRAVIGVASTVLYEALAMGCHVFVCESRYADFYVDDAFGATIGGLAGVSRMAETLSSGGPPPLGDEQLARYWKPNAIEGFRDYVDLGRASSPPWPSRLS